MIYYNYSKKKKMQVKYYYNVDDRAVQNKM